MSNRLNPEDFGLNIYNRFPPSYREDDIDTKYALKRYIEAASEGGFKHIIDEQNGILDIKNPQTCSNQVLYLLYKQYGLDLFYGIPSEFLRAFLPNLGTAWAKKGSFDVIDFLVSSLSGIKTETRITYDKNDNPYVAVRLEMDNAVSKFFPDSAQFQRLLRKFVPFYCDLGLIYYYYYSDIADILVKDYEGTIQIKDTKMDIVKFDKDLDPLLSTKIKLAAVTEVCNIIESKGFIIDEALISNIRYLLSYYELFQDTIKHLILETSSVSVEDEYLDSGFKTISVDNTLLEVEENNRYVIKETVVHEDTGDINQELHGFIMNSSEFNSGCVLTYFEEHNAITVGDVKQDMYL